MWLEYFLSSLNGHIQPMLGLLRWPNTCLKLQWFKRSDKRATRAADNCTIRSRAVSSEERVTMLLCLLSCHCGLLDKHGQGCGVESDKTEMRQTEETISWFCEIIQTMIYFRFRYSNIFCDNDNDMLGLKYLK